MISGALVWLMLAQAPTTPLSGVVVGPDGNPVEGVELILVGMPSFDAPLVGRTKTGADGRFSIDRPDSLAGDHHPQRAPILWAIKPGFRASTTRFPEALPKADEPTRVTLVPAGEPAKVRVDDPDGKPLAGARVLPGRLKSDYTLVPDPVAELIAGTTGGDGVASIGAIPPDELIYLDVHAKGYGIQGTHVSPTPDRAAVVALRAGSTWRGRLVADDPSLAKGWKVRAWTRLYNQDGGVSASIGYAEATSDDQGRFALDPIASGPLQLQLTPPTGDPPVIADVPNSLQVAEGREDSVEIPLRKPAVVTGRILERGTGKPIPGAQVTLFDLGARSSQHLNGKTDADGRYTFRCFPGKRRLSVHQLPPSHVQGAGQGWEDFDVPDGTVKPIEMATREVIPAAPPLNGRVVDEAGRPVPRATVQAQWTMRDRAENANGGAWATADEQGRFALAPLGPDSEVTITAKFQARRTSDAVKARAGSAEPVTVAITPAATVAVAGRLLGPGGTPLAGVAVNVEYRIPQNNGSFPGFPQRAQFDGVRQIKTGPDGTFRTPREVERTASDVRVEVTADGYLPARTEWVPLTPADLVALPDLTLKRNPGVRAVSGRVVDRDGKPIAGARVGQSGDGPRPTSAKTDADGRFTINGVRGGPALVYAEAADFRVGGAIVTGQPGPIEVRLARVSEPPIAPLKAQFSPLGRAEERALARELLGPVLPLARAGSLGILNDSALPTLARVDPDRVLGMIENRTIGGIPAVLDAAALAQFEEDRPSALATIEADGEPGSRALGWLALDAFRPAADRASRSQLLDRALDDARRAPDLETKIDLLGQVPARWLEIGDLGRARPILLEGQRLIASLQPDRLSFQAEAFGEVLAVVDLPAAIKLMERKGFQNLSNISEGEIQRHRAGASAWLAPFDPAGAEGMLPAIVPNYWDRSGDLIRIGRRMARADLPRARAILEKLREDQDKPSANAGPEVIAFGLGRIAEELAESDPARARALLDEAFDGLRKAGTTYAWSTSTANLMAELLPIVEIVEPDRLLERIWTIVAARAPLPLEPKAQEVQGTIALAMLIAPYDRAIADVVAAPALERLRALLDESTDYYDNGQSDTTFRCLTAYDPRAIMPLLSALPDSARKSKEGDTWRAASADSRLRLAAARMLGLPPSARPREAFRVGMGIWPSLFED